MMTTGSIGAGIRIALGSEVTLEERSDDRITVTMDGTEADAAVTRRLLGAIRPDRGYDVTVRNDLPVGQGFGMSAAGAIAAALAATGDMDDSFQYAHRAEIEGGGGLGDVSALSLPVHQPVRVRAGLPPHGEVIGTGLRFDSLTLAVVGRKMHTGSVLDDPKVCARMEIAGERCVEGFVRDPTEGRLFSLSREFSRSVGLESDDVREALDLLTPHGPAGMCMLGHSIFTTLPEDEVRDILGDVPIYSCPSTDGLPRII
ncbi:MAG: pantothenate kinase [Candidatus Methanomethylophilaceae archaeon]